MVDIKKFVAYFLVLASIASSVAFALSGVVSAPAAKNAGAFATLTPALENTPPPVSKNAFVEQVPDTSPKVDIEPGLPPVITTDNLTQNVAQGLTREFFRANANGPQVVDGETALSLPSDSQIDSAIVQKLASDDTASLVSLPTFGEAVPQSDVKINQDNSPEALYEYLTSLNKAFKDTIDSKDFADLMAREPSFEAISAAELAHSRALYAIKSLSVPSKAAALHISALTLVADAKKFLEVPAPESSDPFKTLIVMRGLVENIKTVIEADTKNFAEEFKKLEAQGISAAPPRDTRGSIARMLIRKAYALPVAVPTGIVFDISQPAITTSGSTYGNWLHEIWKWAQKAILQQLIHALILTVQQQVVGWINGNGSPQFVTDWKSLIGITYQRNSDSVVNQIAQIACEGFRANLRVGLLSNQQIYGNRFGCTIRDIINNLHDPERSFSVNFSAGGGFESYGKLLQQNFYIISMEASDEALNRAIAAQNATKNEAVAGGGFLSTKGCGTSEELRADGCYDIETGIRVGNPVITTPGKTLGDTVSKALGLGPDSIVNAQDITGLISAIVNASINRVILAGASGLLGTYSSRGDASYGGKQNTELCGGLTGVRLDECRVAAGKAIEAEGAKPPGSTPPPGGFVAPAFSPVETQTAVVDLTGNSASAEQFPCTWTDYSGKYAIPYPAKKAIDGSEDSFSSVRCDQTVSPAWWSVTLTSPEYLDEIKFTTHIDGTKDNPWGALHSWPTNAAKTTWEGPFIVLTEDGIGGQTTKIAINPPPRATTQINTLTAHSEIVPVIPVNWRSKKIKKVTIQGALDYRSYWGILLSEVVLYRHLKPEILISNNNFPSTLTIAAGTNPPQYTFDPADAAWVRAKYYPTWNTPTDLPQTEIAVVIKNPQNNNQVVCNAPAGRAGAASCSLSPGTYTLEYTATKDGFTSAPAIQTVTVIAAP